MLQIVVLFPLYHVFKTKYTVVKLNYIYSLYRHYVHLSSLHGALFRITVTSAMASLKKKQLGFICNFADLLFFSTFCSPITQLQSS